MAKVDYTMTKFQITSTSTTGAYHDIGPYITEMSGLELEGLTEEIHGMGAVWTENAFVGVKQISPITISGFYDNAAASGPVALLGNTSDIGAERNIKLNMGTTNAYPKLDVIIRKFSRRPIRSELTKFECEFLPCSTMSIVAT